MRVLTCPDVFIMICHCLIFIILVYFQFHPDQAESGVWSWWSPFDEDAAAQCSRK